jgi:phosphatidylserine decarboxylase
VIKNKILDLVMPILPKNDLSHWVGRLVHKKVPGPLGRKMVRGFAKAYNLNMNEAEHPIEHYQSVGDLFTRKLKAGVRPIAKGIVHPCDAVITQAGRIDSGKLIQAKGKMFGVAELLRSSHWAEKFHNGTFVTYYLCPTDYHRVHSPMTGKVKWSTHVPGELWPVNNWSVDAIAELFTVNERVAFTIEAEQTAALVMVAATNVGNITISFDEKVKTNAREPELAPRERSYDPAIEIKKGDEVGIFHLGSTVIMLYEEGMVSEESATRLIGQAVKLGETLQAP